MGVDYEKCIGELLHFYGDVTIERIDGGNRGAGYSVGVDDVGELAFDPSLSHAVLKAYQSLA